ncbi:hypothetical protein BDW59DRAFT_164304 [Aspergillus cavernicola]|uniref:Nephrocystin 3-like N-terminal domain-containing protein n=1 Tax=Aspergillus cavernicola TaxID=176166 RepID=A0ABR4I0J6_9EURO
MPPRMPFSNDHNTYDRFHYQMGGQTAIWAVPNEVLRKLDASKDREQKDRYRDPSPEACKWFVTNSDFQAWRARAGQTSQILWVFANHGSAFAKYLADYVLEEGALRAPAVGYFFFKDDSEDGKSITKARCGNLHQLFAQNRGLLTEAILDRFDIYKAITETFHLLWDVLTDVAKEKNTGEIVCFLDALDECEQHGRFQFTEALRKSYTDGTPHDLNLKFLITCPSGHIQPGSPPLNIPGQLIIQLPGDIDVEMAQEGLQPRDLTPDDTYTFGRKMYEERRFSEAEKMFREAYA